MEKELRVVELFSGIGSQAKALKNQRINHKIIAISDWDIYAIISYALVHENKKFTSKYKNWLEKFNQVNRERERERERIESFLSNFTLSRDGKNPIRSLSTIKIEILSAIEIAIKLTNNLVDIKEIKGSNIKEHDLLTYSFPCQDLSLQGSQKGLMEGKSSSMLWEVKRIISELKIEDKLPKYLLLENVKSLFSKKYEIGFNEWLNYLEKIGYKNHKFSLNSKHFDTPQNRERAFVFSELKQNKFKKENLISKTKITNKTIKDILEDNFEYFEIPRGYVEDLKPEKKESGIAKSKIIGYTSFQSEAAAFSKESISPTITATGAQNRIKVIEDNGRLRLLQSSELWKLMGFSKDDWRKATTFSLIPDQYLKKQAGNSIPVKVLEAIFKEIK